MITIKDISKEILLECRKARPNEFTNVSRTDIERVCNIFMRRIRYILLSGSLLAIKDFMLFRPNLQEKIRSRKIMLQKIREKGINAEYKSLGKNNLLDF